MKAVKRTGLTDNAIVQIGYGRVKRDAPRDPPEQRLTEALNVPSIEMLAVCEDVTLYVRPSDQDRFDEPEQFLLIERRLAPRYSDEAVRFSQKASTFEMSKAVDVVLLRRLRAHYAELITALGHQKRVVSRT